MGTRKHNFYLVACRIALIARSAAVVLALGLMVHAHSDAQGVFSAGETLRYKVRWSFIRLGTVEIKQCSTDSRVPDLRQFALSVKSASGLPFVDLDFTHTASATIDPLEVNMLTVIERNGDQPKTTYQIESTAQQLIVIDSCKGVETQRDTIAIADKCYEALSLLIIARTHASMNKKMVIPTMVGKSVGETVLQFTGETEEIDVPALEDPVVAYQFTGDARWVGSSFAGMSGAFKGWISRDEAAVPLRAEVGIFLGSIVLELESIERPHWQPGDTASSAVLREP